jgi:SET domain-containing protein
MYKPLPKELRLGFSDIHDIGVFAKEFIPKGTNLGMSHMKLKDTIFRTPLGGFLNHSDDPNCCKVELLMTNDSFDYKKWNLMTIEDIKEGKELTLTYTFYKIND